MHTRTQVCLEIYKMIKNHGTWRDLPTEGGWEFFAADSIPTFAEAEPPLSDDESETDSHRRFDVHVNSS